MNSQPLSITRSADERIPSVFLPQQSVREEITKNDLHALAHAHVEDEANNNVQSQSKPEPWKIPERARITHTQSSGADRQFISFNFGAGSYVNEDARDRSQAREYTHAQHAKVRQSQSKKVQHQHFKVSKPQKSTSSRRKRSSQLASSAPSTSGTRTNSAGVVTLTAGGSGTGAADYYSTHYKTKTMSIARTGSRKNVIYAKSVHKPVPSHIVAPKCKSRPKTAPGSSETCTQLQMQSKRPKFTASRPNQYEHRVDEAPVRVREKDDVVVYYSDNQCEYEEAFMKLPPPSTMTGEPELQYQYQYQDLGYQNELLSECGGGLPDEILTRAGPKQLDQPRGGQSINLALALAAVNHNGDCIGCQEYRTLVRNYEDAFASDNQVILGQHKQLQTLACTEEELKTTVYKQKELIASLRRKIQAAMGEISNLRARANQVREQEIEDSRSITKKPVSPRRPSPRFEHPVHEEFQERVSGDWNNNFGNLDEDAELTMKIAALRTALSARQALQNEVRSRVAKANEILNEQFGHVALQPDVSISDLQLHVKIQGRFVRWLNKFIAEGIHDIQNFERTFIFTKGRKVRYYYEGLMAINDEEVEGIFIPMDVHQRAEAMTAEVALQSLQLQPRPHQQRPQTAQKCTSTFDLIYVNHKGTFTHGMPGNPEASTSTSDLNFFRTADAGTETEPEPQAARKVLKDSSTLTDRAGQKVATVEMGSQTLLEEKASTSTSTSTADLDSGSKVPTYSSKVTHASAPISTAFFSCEDFKDNQFSNVQILSSESELRSSLEAGSHSKSEVSAGHEIVSPRESHRWTCAAKFPATRPSSREHDQPQSLQLQSTSSVSAVLVHAQPSYCYSSQESSSMSSLASLTMTMTMDAGPEVTETEELYRRPRVDCQLSSVDAFDMNQHQQLNLHLHPQSQQSPSPSLSPSPPRSSAGAETETETDSSAIAASRNTSLESINERVNSVRQLVKACSQESLEIVKGIERIKSKSQSRVSVGVDVDEFQSCLELNLESETELPEPEPESEPETETETVASVVTEFKNMAKQLVSTSCSEDSICTSRIEAYEVKALANGMSPSPACSTPGSTLATSTSASSFHAIDFPKTASLVLKSSVHSWVANNHAPSLCDLEETTATATASGTSTSTTELDIMKHILDTPGSSEASVAVTLEAEVKPEHSNTLLTNEVHALMNQLNKPAADKTESISVVLQLQIEQPSTKPPSKIPQPLPRKTKFTPVTSKLSPIEEECEEPSSSTISTTTAPEKGTLSRPHHGKSFIPRLRSKSHNSCRPPTGTGTSAEATGCTEATRSASTPCNRQRNYSRSPQPSMCVPPKLPERPVSARAASTASKGSEPSSTSKYDTKRVAVFPRPASVNQQQQSQSQSPRFASTSTSSSTPTGQLPPVPPRVRRSAYSTEYNSSYTMDQFK